MEQRRVFLFITLSFAVLVLNGLFLAKAPEPAKKIEADAQQQQAADPPGEGVGVEAAPIVDAIVDAEEEAVEKIADFPEEEETFELTYLSLGSVDPDSAYRGLFTFTSQGAAIVRVELASPKYRDLQDRSGYIGHLELIPDATGGLKVQVVGPGTPAALAGVEVGDRILSVDEKKESVKLESAQQFAELLARRKPNGKFTFTVARGEEKPQQLVATLGRRPLEVIRPESENVLMREKKLPEGFFEEPSFLFTLQNVGQDRIRPAKGEIPEADEMDGVELRESNWEVAASDRESITFRKLVPRYKLELLKRYTLATIPADEQSDENYPAYGLTLDLEVRNLDSKAIDLSYRLDGPNGLPIEGWWYARKSGWSWGTVGLRDVVGRYFGSETAEQTATDIANGEGKDFEGGSMAFIGVDAQYFSAMMLPVKESVEDVWLELVRPVSLSPKPKSRSSDGLFANVTCRLISKTSVLQAGEALTHSYTIFTGPKRPELLANYQSSADPKYTLRDSMTYGWFGKVAQAMLWILHTFYGLVGNYGLAIVMLTVLVRSCLFPLSRKQAQSMAKMQELKPELEKIKEKYKSDTAKQSQAMQELYRKYNINPLGGCLPMFVQLPIFVGLYRALAVDVELRQAPLISDTVRWCSNLAAPDMLLNWSSFMPTFITSGTGFLGLGPYLNVLPLVTIGLFILQQKMFMPEATNEQAALQQKIMQYMMIFMGFMFFKVASGLCLYFIASSLWGIAERKLVPAPKIGGLANAPVAETRSSRGSKNGSASRDSARPKKKRANLAARLLMIPDLADTIAAIGTATGSAARGMIRVSGPATIDCLTRRFRPASRDQELPSISFPQLISGEFLWGEASRSLPCDLFLWPDERSYTRQPSAELHVLGSPPLLEQMLADVCRQGARIAEPGEFTLRAFLAGRLDLTQAEAVLGVIDAADSQSFHTALGQLAGGLSKPLSELREQLLQLLAHLEAGLDFAEEDISFISAAEIQWQLGRAQELVAATLSQLANRNQPQVLPKVVLTGRPNAGKSSLFNALVEEFAPSDERSPALVSSQAGTTRDYLAAAVDFQGQLCELVDTAGIDPSMNERSLPGFAQNMTTDQRRRADCHVLCIDATEPHTTREIADYAAEENKSMLLAITKSDLLPAESQVSKGPRICLCSSRTGSGLSQLAASVAGELRLAKGASNAVASTAARCVDSLQRAAESLDSAMQLVAQSGGEELIAAETRSALQELGRVVGVVYSDDVLDRIFSQFCIGK